MADDPFAQYVTHAADPFAAYATSAGQKDGAAEVRKQITAGFAARPMFEPGAGAAMLGAQSDPREVVSGALNAINPIAWLRGLSSSAQLALHPQQIPAAANDALSQVLGHPGYAAGGALAGTAAGAAAGAAASQMPMGRLLTAGAEGAKAGAMRLPLVGPPMRAAARAAARSWSESAPAAVETAESAAPAMATGTAFKGGAPLPNGPIPWLIQRTANAAPAAAEAMPTAAATPAGGLSAAERAALTKQGYPTSVIAKIEQQASRPAPMASHAPGPEFQPVDAPAARATGPTPSAVSVSDQPIGLQPGFSRSDVAQAATQMQRENPNIVAEAEQMRQRAALQGPRIQTGAERVGRQAGMSTQDVRQAAGPVLDEARGEASPILPQAALERIIDDLKQLPRGGPEREAYVARATSGKTKAQVENARRTLEHLGFVVPAAVSVREGLQRLMSSHAPSDQ